MELRKISKEELEEILKLHKMWLDGEEDGKRADLSCTDLSGADLSGADLSYSDLIYANLSHTDLSYSNLSHAYLNGGNLSCANLSGADLSGANLSGADLNNVKYNETTLFFTMQCPEKGSFIGYKKSDNKIVELRIEEDSKRSSATSRKCRASKVTVLSITSLDGKENFEEVTNTSRYKFTYKVGETYTIDNFDDDRWNECSTGIHFFTNRDEAVNY